MSKPLVLFLCTGNACRSQMAEGFARQLASERWDVASAGVAPTQLDPRAVAAMAEVGVDISRQVAKALDPSLLARAAMVVTLCGDAAERCPLPPPGVGHIHWPLPDPARARGSEEEVAAAFRRVRDEIRRGVQQLLDDRGGH